MWSICWSKEAFDCTNRWGSWERSLWMHPCCCLCVIHSLLMFVFAEVSLKRPWQSKQTTSCTSASRDNEQYSNAQIVLLIKVSGVYKHTKLVSADKVLTDSLSCLTFIWPWPQRPPLGLWARHEERQGVGLALVYWLSMVRTSWELRSKPLNSHWFWPGRWR